MTRGTAWLALLLATSSSLAGPFGGGPFGSGGGGPASAIVDGTIVAADFAAGAAATTTTAGVVRLGVDVPAYYVLAADQTNATTVLADATGLTFVPEASSTYFVEFYGMATSTNLNEGFQWQWTDGTSGSVYSSGHQWAPASAVSNLWRYGVTGTSIAGTTFAATGTATTVTGWAMVQTGAAPGGGAFKLQFKTENGAGQSVTLLKGAFLRVIKVG
jgi:hypothetical protein